MGAAVDNTGVVNALFGGSIARRLRRRLRLRLRASAALAEGDVSTARCGRCFGCFGCFLRASTVISPGPSMPSSASSAAVLSITS